MVRKNATNCSGFRVGALGFELEGSGFRDRALGFRLRSTNCEPEMAVSFPIVAIYNDV